MLLSEVTSSTVNLFLLVVKSVPQYFTKRVFSINFLSYCQKIPSAMTELSPDLDISVTAILDVANLRSILNLFNSTCNVDSRYSDTYGTVKAPQESHAGNEA